MQDIGYDVRPRALRQGGVEERSVRGKLSQVGKPFSVQPFLTVPTPPRVGESQRVLSKGPWTAICLKLPLSPKPGATVRSARLLGSLSLFHPNSTQMLNPSPPVPEPIWSHSGHQTHPLPDFLLSSALATNLTAMSQLYALLLPSLTPRPQPSLGHCPRRSGSSRPKAQTLESTAIPLCQSTN